MHGSPTFPPPRCGGSVARVVVPTSRESIDATSPCPRDHRHRLFRRLLTAGMAGAAPASAKSQDHQRLAPRTHFVMAPDGSSGLRADGAGIPNIDSVKKTVRTYYGAGDDGIANKTDSPYIREMSADRPRAVALPRPGEAAGRSGTTSARPSSSTPTTPRVDLRHGGRGDALQLRPRPPGHLGAGARSSPPRPSMVGFVNRAARMGFTIFGITGRTDTQEAATVANLAKVGYTRSTRTTSTPSGRAATRSRVRHLRRQVHHRRVQGRHPQAHREGPRLRHRAQRRRPVVRPPGRVRRPRAQAAQPDVQPAEPRPRRHAADRAFSPAHPLHDEAGRLERRHRRAARASPTSTS